jgi:hypothetical protein
MQARFEVNIKEREKGAKLSTKGVLTELEQDLEFRELL